MILLLEFINVMCSPTIENKIECISYLPTLIFCGMLAETQLFLFLAL